MIYSKPGMLSKNIIKNKKHKKILEKTLSDWWKTKACNDHNYKEMVQTTLIKIHLYFTPYFICSSDNKKQVNKFCIPSSIAEP